VKYLNIQNIKIYLLTFINILKIYFITNNKFKNNKKLRFVLFYFPVQVYQENILELAKKLKQNKNIYVFLVYNRYLSSGIANQKNSFLLNLEYLRFIPFSNILLQKIHIFISNYVAYVFPTKSKNIYISHNIMDAPLVNKEIENKLFSHLSKLDYIFLPSDIAIKYFKKKLIYFFRIRNRKTPELINTGYLKLDYVKKKLNFLKNKKDSILIAPTVSSQMKEFNISHDLIKIIKILLKNTKEKIIYRPHPLDLTKKGNINFIKKIVNIFKNNKDFSADLSKSYLNSYSRAKFLITDFSSTAYTFSYSALCPVLFYSKNEKKLSKSKLASLIYFQDRLKVGYVLKNVNQILLKVQKLNIMKSKFKKRIINLRKKRIKYLDKSLKKTHDEILNIIE
jgi:hypothetical protein